ncbi:hypothetical protein JKP88DRAFT_254232 [Tribonema minus]|uniref:Uncharacterized protein n=1 Tax=Tribonema minus TaxID=303371 RepID=A0A835Z4H1_9STRA|nr:hypothetical protein JKP88DRAFT_254232 [Tribonema minus]
MRAIYPALAGVSAYATAQRRCLAAAASQSAHVQRAVKTLFIHDPDLSLQAFHAALRSKKAKVPRETDRVRLLLLLPPPPPPPLLPPLLPAPLASRATNAPGGGTGSRSTRAGGSCYLMEQC